ncbi:hypothetical protein COJE103337_08155 [Corynebacterium jeikeium]|uniref:hypothetical protein n=1 Tax=Corynebacterium jeikeium TaxID=38289 RepID=UPI000E178D53|nr:hypothetical protein [Corynebacterium jeikeium]SUY81452.1 Uncharacterised protein [Corynebacterium jeikeium]
MCSENRGGKLVDVDVFYRTFDVSDVAPGANVLDLIFHGLILFTVLSSIMAWAAIIILISRSIWRKKNPGRQTRMWVVFFALSFAIYVISVPLSFKLVLFPGGISSRIYTLDKYGNGRAVPMVTEDSPMNTVRMDHTKKTFLEKYHREVLDALSSAPELMQYDLVGCRDQGDDKHEKSILCGGYLDSGVHAVKGGKEFSLNPHFHFGERPEYIRESIGMDLENSPGGGMPVRLKVYISGRS